jgi:hypothetical protein
MRRAIIVLAALTLSGCLPERAKDMAECQKEASRFYESYRATDPNNPAGRFLIGCMATKGYEYSIVAAACSNDHPFPNQPGCYVSRTWSGWIAEQFGAD